MQKLNRVDQPSVIEEWTFRDFAGMNTQAYRTSIDDTQFAWLEGIMPIGYGNLKTVPGVSAALQTFAGKTGNYLFTYNQAGVDLAFVACTDGAAFTIQLTPPFTRTVVGPAGTFTSGGVAAAQWNNAGLVIIDTVKGYMDWNITAPVTLTVIDNTVLGYDLAVFSGRVWIVLNSGRTVKFTDVGSYNSFAGSGGFFVMNDPSLHDKIRSIDTANNFLYVWGNDSANTISDVRVVGGIAVFSNVNIETMAGTSFPLSVFPYFRAMMFAAPYGFYQLYGATPTKVSDELDGVFPLIDLSKVVSGGTVVINNIVCAAWVFTYNDPVVGPRQLVAIFHNKKWFVANQGNMLRVSSTSIAGKQCLFGTDGNSLFQLFQDTVGNVDTKVVTKLYPHNSSIYTKSILRIGCEIQLPVAIISITATADTEMSSGEVLLLSASSAITWVGSGVITWIGAGVITWVGLGPAAYGIDATNFGKYVGITLQSTSPQYQLTNLMMRYQETGADW